MATAKGRAKKSPHRTTPGTTPGVTHPTASGAKKCSRCPRRARPERTTCERCARAQRVARRRVPKGICRKCRKAPARRGFRTCETCAEHRRLAGKLRREARAAAGACSRCNQPCADGYTWCEACRTQKKIATVRRTEAKEARGECAWCPRKVAYGSLCKACNAKRRARDRKPNPLRVMHCSVCGEARHNARACPYSEAEIDRMRRGAA